MYQEELDIAGSGYNDPPLKGRTAMETRIANILRDSYCIRSHRNGFDKYRRRFNALKKTPHAVVAALRLMVREKRLTFNWSNEIVTMLQDYLMEYVPVRSGIKGMLTFLDFLRKTGQYFDVETYSRRVTGSTANSYESDHNKVRWFMEGSKELTCFCNLTLLQQVKVLQETAKKDHDLVVMRAAMKRMLAKLKITAPLLRKYRDEILADQFPEPLLEKVFLSLVETHTRR